MKTLFQEDGRYTSDAIYLLGQMRKLIKPIIKGYGKKGYPIRKISHVIQAAISDFEAEYILTNQVLKAKENGGNIGKKFAIDQGIISPYCSEAIDEEDDD